MKSEDYKLINESWNKFINEEEAINEVDMPETLPGLALLLNIPKYIPYLIAYLEKVGKTDQDSTASLRKVADLSNKIVESLEQLKKDNPKIYALLVTAVLAKDPVGTVLHGKLMKFLKRDDRALLQKIKDHFKGEPEDPKLTSLEGEDLPDLKRED
jgi:hypothetical protein